jgi:hypothetical protein
MARKEKLSFFDEQDRQFELPSDAKFTEEDYLIAKLAWEKGLAYSKILDELKKKRPRASNEKPTKNEPQEYMKAKRALQNAVRHGLVVLNPPPHTQLEEELRTKYQLEEVHVEIDRTATCLKAARLIAAKIQAFIDGPEHRMIVANAGGKTVRDTVTFLQRVVPLPPDLKGKELIFLSLNAAEDHEKFDQCANYHCVRMSQIYGAPEARHFAVVKRQDEQMGREYEELLDNIDLLISSAGGRDGFLVNRLQTRGINIPPAQVGDVAFHLVDSRGREVVLKGDAQELVEQELVRAPDWEDVVRLFNQRKVLLILTGDKTDVAQALLGRSLVTMCVIDSRLARELTRSKT